MGSQRPSQAKAQETQTHPRFIWKKDMRVSERKRKERKLERRRRGEEQKKRKARKRRSRDQRPRVPNFNPRHPQCKCFPLSSIDSLFVLVFPYFLWLHARRCGGHQKQVTVVGGHTLKKGVRGWLPNSDIECDNVHHGDCTHEVEGLKENLSLE